jgi:hypothetical protein
VPAPEHPDDSFVSTQVCPSVQSPSRPLLCALTVENCKLTAINANVNATARNFIVFFIRVKFKRFKNNISKSSTLKPNIQIFKLKNSD